MSKPKTVPPPAQPNRPKGELAVIPREEYCTYVQIFILKADGAPICYNQRTGNQRDGRKIELPRNAIAYRFFDALSVFSSARHNWRRRGMSTACNHSVVFGTDHQKICDDPADEALATIARAKLELFRAEGLLK